MVDPGKILDRIRSHGANVMLDGDKLVIVNPAKLPDGARDFIRQHAKEIAAYLSDEAEFEERAAIVEHDGGAPREMAERFALACIEDAKGRWPEPDRAWFITQCARIIDEAAAIEASTGRAA